MHAYLCSLIYCRSERGRSAQMIEIFGIRGTTGQKNGEFVSLQVIASPLRAMAFRGDLLAASDDINETHVINWRSRDYAVLWGSDEASEHNFQVS